MGHREGIRISEIFGNVVTTFGKPWNETYDSTTDSLGYSAGPNNDVGNLSFKNGKLVRAKWYVNPC